MLSNSRQNAINLLVLTDSCAPGGKNSSPTIVVLCKIQHCQKPCCHPDQSVLLLLKECALFLNTGAYVSCVLSLNILITAQLSMLKHALTSCDTVEIYRPLQ